MHALAVIHRRRLCENVDGAKIKVNTDIDILRVASMYRIVIHRIDTYQLIVTRLISSTAIFVAIANNTLYGSKL